MSLLQPGPRWNVCTAINTFLNVNVLVPHFVPAPCTPHIYQYRRMNQVITNENAAWHVVIRSDVHDELTAAWTKGYEGIYCDVQDLQHVPGFSTQRGPENPFNYQSFNTLDEAKAYWNDKCREVHLRHPLNCGAHRERKEKELQKDAEEAQLSLFYNELTLLAPATFPRDTTRSTSIFPAPATMHLKGFHLYVVTHVEEGADATRVNSLKEAQIEMDKPFHCKATRPKQIYLAQNADDAISFYYAEVRRTFGDVEQSVRIHGCFPPPKR